MVRAAAVQLNSTEDRKRNLGAAERLTREAAADGAQLVVLPERADLRASNERYLSDAIPADGETTAWARELARELSIDLVVGSFTERREGHDKLSNTSLHVGPDGEVKAVYRKIHMFDVVVGGVDYRESDANEPGDEIVVSETANGIPLGLTVCYDLRFPELYRILAVKGARIVTIPANFTRLTGEAHWELLIRARAVENQVFVIAPGQIGECPPGQPAWGHSMIVDPWGDVLAVAPDAECFVAADLDFARQDDVREKLPSLANRMPGTYRWPEEPDLRPEVEVSNRYVGLDAPRR
jgi:deaminated glutathione amidase